MIFKFGKRISKKSDEDVGWEELDNPSEIDTSKPIIICLSGNGTRDPKSANGACKLVTKMLGVDKIEDSPCNIYGAYYTESVLGTAIFADVYEQHETVDDYDFEKARFSSFKDEKKRQLQYDKMRHMEQSAKEFVDQVFVPLIQDESGKTLDKSEIARNFRKVHFVDFCFGSVMQLLINRELHKTLSSRNFSQEEIANLESQICVLQASPIIKESKTGHTTVNFGSLEDDTFTGFSIGQQLYLKSGGLREGEVARVDSSEQKNPTVIVKEFTTISDDEEHYGRNYLALGEQSEEYVGGILPLLMSVGLRRAVQNSVCNENAKNFVPLKSEDVTTPFVKFADWANHNPTETPKALEEIFNKNVDYKNINLMDDAKVFDNKEKR